MIRVATKKQKNDRYEKCHIAIRGCLRTGTNLSHYVFRYNYNLLISSDDKHTYYDYPFFVKVSPKHLYVTIKHPISWIISARNYRHKGLGISYAINAEVPKWNKFYKGYLSLIGNYPKNVQIIKYEDLVTNPEKICDNFLKNCGINYNAVKKGEFYFPINKMGESNQESLEPFDISYYLDKKYINYITDKEIDQLKNTIDLDIVKELGYYL